MVPLLLLPDTLNSGLLPSPPASIYFSDFSNSCFDAFYPGFIAVFTARHRVRVCLPMLSRTETEIFLVTKFLHGEPEF